MINTALPASNSVYGREKLFRYDKINVSNHVCHCGAVVKEFLARADKPGSTTLLFCFFVPFFFPCLVYFFNTIFPFGLFFSLFLLQTPPVQHPPVTHWRKLSVPFVHRLNHQYYYRKISTGFAPET